MNPIETNIGEDDGGSTQKGGMRVPQQPLSIAIKDKPALYTAYMPFIKNGGLFIPTKKEFHKGDKLALVISLPDNSDKIEVHGTVVWLTPVGAQGARAAGLGVQFEGEAGKKLNERIKQLLANDLQGTDPTHTM